jgi:hypothetical protein
MLTGFPWFALAGSPLGSPKPPVWTWDGARAMVGAAELPVENTFVATPLGIAGAGLGGSGSSFLAAILTFGAEGSSTFTALGWGAGSRKALTGGSTFATNTGFGSGRTGCGWWLTGTGVLTNWTERNVCSGGETIAGCSKRNHIKNATTQACAPVLKTNSVQGVLVLGSNENGVWCEAEYAIAAYSINLEIFIRLESS